MSYDSSHLFGDGTGDTVSFGADDTDFGVLEGIAQSLGVDSSLSVSSSDPRPSTQNKHPQAAPEPRTVWRLSESQWRPFNGHVVSAAYGQGLVLLGTTDGHIIAWHPQTHKEFKKIQLKNVSTQRVVSGKDFEETVVKHGRFSRYLRPATPSQDSIYRVFMDPSARHALISMCSGIVYYLNLKTFRHYALSKLKNVVVSAVGWNVISASRSCTGSILVGTLGGHIYEVVIKDKKERYFKLIYDLASTSQHSDLLHDSHESKSHLTDGARFFLYPPHNGSVPKNDQIASTPAKNPFLFKEIYTSIAHSMLSTSPVHDIRVDCFNKADNRLPDRNGKRNRCHVQVLVSSAHTLLQFAGIARAVSTSGRAASSLENGGSYADIFAYYKGSLCSHDNNSSSARPPKLSTSMTDYTHNMTVFPQRSPHACICDYGDARYDFGSRGPEGKDAPTSFTDNRYLIGNVHKRVGVLVHDGLLLSDVDYDLQGAPFSSASIRSFQKKKGTSKKDTRRRRWPHSQLFNHELTIPYPPMVPMHYREDGDERIMDYKEQSPRLSVKNHAFQQTYPELNQNDGASNMLGLDTGGGRQVYARSVPEIPPLSVAMTEFHYLILYPTCVVGVHRVSLQMVFLYRFCVRDGQVLSLNYDPLTRRSIIVTRRHIFSLRIDGERRNVWRIYYNLKQYSAALQLDLPAREAEIVLNARANKLLEEGRYSEAAAEFAFCKSARFEEVALKFISLGPDHLRGLKALKSYVKSVLSTIPIDSADVSVTLLSTWLVEIYIHLLHKYESAESTHRPAVQNNQLVSFVTPFEAAGNYIDGFQQDKTQPPASRYDPQAPQYGRMSMGLYRSTPSRARRQQDREYGALQEEFRRHLRTSVTDKFDSGVHRGIACQLLQEHGREEDILVFHKKTHELAYPVHYFTSRGLYQQALAYLRKSERNPQFGRVFARLLCELMIQAPVATIKLVKATRERLVGLELLPGLLMYDTLWRSQREHLLRQEADISDAVAQPASSQHDSEQHSVTQPSDKDDNLADLDFLSMDLGLGESKQESGAHVSTASSLTSGPSSTDPQGRNTQPQPTQTVRKHSASGKESESHAGMEVLEQLLSIDREALIRVVPESKFSGPVTSSAPRGPSHAKNISMGESDDLQAMFASIINTSVDTEGGFDDIFGNNSASNDGDSGLSGDRQSGLQASDSFELSIDSRDFLRKNIPNTHNNNSNNNDSKSDKASTSTDGSALVTVMSGAISSHTVTALACFLPLYRQLQRDLTGIVTPPPPFFPRTAIVSPCEHIFHTYLLSLYLRMEDQQFALAYLARFLRPEMVRGCVAQEAGADGEASSSRIIALGVSAGQEGKALGGYQVVRGQEMRLPFDLTHALRLAHAHQRHIAVCLLNWIRGQYYLAVEVALERIGGAGGVCLAVEIVRFAERNAPLALRNQSQNPGEGSDGVVASSEEGILPTNAPFSDAVVAKLRRFWLKICRYLVQEIVTDDSNSERSGESGSTGDASPIRAVLAFISRCSLLTLDDALPLFPSFVSLGELHHQIVNGMTSYQRRVAALKSSMQECISSSERIRDNLMVNSKRYAEVFPTDLCDLCDEPALSKPVFMFDCSHTFHMECAIKECRRWVDSVKGYGGPAKLEKLWAERWERVVRSQQQSRVSNTSDHLSDATTKVQEVISTQEIGLVDFSEGASGDAELRINEQKAPPSSSSLGIDTGGGLTPSASQSFLPSGPPPLDTEALAESLASSECCLCGTVMIESIDQPFVDNIRELETVQAWMLQGKL